MNALRHFGLFHLLLALLAFGAVVSAQYPTLVDPAFTPPGGANNDVFTIALQPDGRILIGGQFTAVNGIARGRVARLNANGALDESFVGDSGGDIYAVALQEDGKVLIGGAFTLYGATSTPYLARLDPNGLLDTSFNSSLAINNELRGIIVLPDGQILICGRFSRVAGQTRGRVARLTSNGSLDASYAVGSGADNNVRCMTVQPDGKLLIGGTFLNVHGQARSRIARLNTDGSLDTTFDPGAGASDQVRSIAVAPNGDIYIGGDFKSYGGVARPGVARLLSDGTLDTTFDPTGNYDSAVRAVILHPEGKLWVGGQFSQLGGALRGNVARLNLDGSADASFDPFPTPAQEVFTLVNQPDGNVLIGGKFLSIDNIERRKVARLLSTNYTMAIAFWPPWGMSVAEDAGMAEVPVHRWGWQGTNVSVDFFTSNGTAVAGVDYIAQSGTMVFTNGQNSGVISVPLVADTVPEPTRHFSVLLTNATPGVRLDPPTNSFLPSNLDVVILDNDEGFHVVVLTNLPAREEWDSIPVEVRRGTDPIGTVSVDYLAVDGTAQNGSDFQLAPGTLTFLPGETNKVVLVPLVHDGVLEGPEHFQFVLTNPSPGAFLGNPSNLVLTLDDQDSTIYFGIINYAWEPNWAAMCYVLRSGLKQSAASVRLRSSDGTATANADYVPIDQVITFAPGEDMKIFYLNVLNDGLVEEGETVNLFLSEPTGNSIVGSLSNAVVTILDNDQSIQFPGKSSIALENSGAALIPIVRRDDGTNSLTVRFDTYNISAAAGYEYVPVSGTFTLTNVAPLTNYISVPLIDDCLPESNKTFLAVLSMPGPGATLGANTSLWITIADDDRPGSLDPTFKEPPVAWGSSIAVQADGKILLGQFNRIRRYEVNGEPDESYGWNYSFGPLHDFALLPDGTVLAGVTGCFPESDPRGLAHILPDGMLDWSYPEHLTCQIVSRIAVRRDGVSLVSSGTYGSPGTALASYSSTGVSNVTFSPPALPPPSVIVVQNDGRWILGFTNASAGLLRLDPDGAVDLLFQPVFQFSPSNSTAGISAILPQPDGKVLVSGDFTNVNSQPRLRLARFNADGTLDNDFAATSMDAPAVSILRQADGRLLLGGAFTNVGGMPRRGVARLNTDGSVDASFDPEATLDGPVSAMALHPDGRLLVIGSFTPPTNGVPVRRLVRLQTGLIRARLDSLSRQPGHVTELRLTGDPCRSPWVEASDNLVDWVPVLTNGPAAGPVLLRDTNAVSARFYRAWQKTE